MQNKITWLTRSFNELSCDQLYDLLKLRVDVFVVEQCCYYHELDNLDRHQQTLHLLVYSDEDLIGYARVLPPKTSYADYVSIGRVAIAKSARGQGLAHQLMLNAIQIGQSRFSTSSIKISAQLYLEKFYQQHGFITVTETYLEDNIPHIGMLKS